ncbi:conserved protein of unknown function [uncultured Sphingopyxis sp.]|uniref:DUF7033 domain-containing protein n=1 Tax=uncultured Sphingopyxis sp. TaxID=310581 RepID=A0A1Y5PZV8_9SPHN|nr:polysaccharide deacetylase family protein [uncultured Sphingopyxis sp.]SBV32774.1 conserved protein of unknown function [uncultured Sphingopyxis sp.]
MTLLLTLPSSRSTPLKWIADIVLGEWLGLPFDLVEGAENAVVLERGGRRLVLASQFPDLAAVRSTWDAQLPMLPLAELDTREAWAEADLEGPLPVLSGLPRIEESENEIHCGIDMFGAIFLMLSRFEEVALPDRDAHDRFPATASLAWKGGFLYRPVVDEYVVLLGAMIRRLWPDVAHPRREGRIRVSCDVDQPFDRVGRSAGALVRSLAGDLVRRRDPRLALRRVRNFVEHRRGDLRFDPYYTFDWYMDACEAAGHSAAFYFIPDHSAGEIDGSYDLFEPRTLALIRAVGARAHEVGVHGSYNTYRDAGQIAHERQRMRDACAQAGVAQAVCGNRQHYLRWDANETPDWLDAAGYDYDTTGCFADRPGFRYGTARSFPMWSWQRLSPLRLRQRPLILMEGSVLADAYLGLGHSSAAMDLMQQLKSRALKHGGDFTLLWHNSYLLTKADRAFFQEIIRKDR